MKRLTASSVALARACLHPFTPDAGPGNSVSGAAAAKGNVEHEHIEGTIEDDDKDEDAEDAEERGHIAASFDAEEVTPKSDTHRRWLNEWWAHERQHKWHAEEAFAINPFTGETRKAPAGWPSRDYSWAPDGFVPGTADAWAVVDGVLRVPDWKTGQAVHVPHPSKSGQLFTLALAIARHIGHRGPISLEYVRVNESRLWVEKALVSRLEILAFQSELGALLRAAEAGAEPVRGPWCKALFCDQRGRCSATVGLVAASVPALVDREPFRVALTASGFRSDAHAAWQYAALDAAEALLKEARAALKERARARPIPLGDGRFYGEVEASNDTFKIDAPGFDEALRKHLGEHAGLVVETKRVAAKGRIEDAAREVAKAKKAAGEKATIKQIYGATLLDLRACGGLKATAYKKLDTYTPKAVEPVAELPRPEESQPQSAGSRHRSAS